MLRNLVSNALKFTRSGGVALIARRLGGTVAFQVLDTGPGIGQERQQRIFDEFERAREQAGGLNEGLPGRQSPPLPSSTLCKRGDATDSSFRMLAHRVTR
jgi:signal transduction histidine kinase